MTKKITTSQKIGVLQNVRTSQKTREEIMRSQGKLSGLNNTGNILKMVKSQDKVFNKMKREATNRTAEIWRGK